MKTIAALSLTLALAGISFAQTAPVAPAEPTAPAAPAASAKKKAAKVKKTVVKKSAGAPVASTPATPPVVK
jgi:hypothetical protein